jgi:hypothetical protein
MPVHKTAHARPGLLVVGDELPVLMYHRIERHLYVDERAVGGTRGKRS